MKIYSTWESRNQDPLPYSVIIDTDEMTVMELTEAESHSGVYSKTIQKIVPNEGWLQTLYYLLCTRKGYLKQSDMQIRHLYNKAQWLEGDGYA